MASTMPAAQRIVPLRDAVVEAVTSTSLLVAGASHVTSRHFSKWPGQCVVGCRSVMSGHALVDYASHVICCRISATADPRSLRFTSIGP